MELSQFDAEASRHTIDKIEKRGKVGDVQYVFVVEPVVSELLDIAFRNLAWGFIELGCVIQHCSIFGIEGKRGVILFHLIYKFIVFRQPTESLPVICISIPTTVSNRDDDSDHFPLYTVQARLTEQKCTEHVPYAVQHYWIKAARLVKIRDSPCFRVLIAIIDFFK